MAMDKKQAQTMESLARIESALTELLGMLASEGPRVTAVTIEQLMEIKGVGEATAEKILELIND